MATNTTLNVRIEEEIKYQASLILGASGIDYIRCGADVSIARN